MILYFADRHMNILGQASTELPGGVFIKDDTKTEELEAGVAIFEFDLYFDDAARAKAEEWANTGNYILRKCGDDQEFYTIIESESSIFKRCINVYAEDAGMDLLNETVSAYTADKAQPAHYYVEKFAYDSGFEVGINEISNMSRKLTWEGEATASERLLSVATQFDAEMAYSFEIDGLRIKHKYINLYRKRGEDNGVQLHINKEINNIIMKKSVADLATGLEVTGGTPEGSEQPITLKGYKYDDGDIYVSGSRVYSRSALAKWSRYLSETGNDVGHIVQSYSYDTTSQSELCNRAVSKLKKIYDVSVTYEVDLAYLPNGIKIGDTVNIVDDDGGLYLSARIMKLELSEANKAYTATLGDYQLKSDGVSEKMTELAAQFEKIAKNRVFYTWTAFADDEKGTGISISPYGKEYLGIATNQLVKEADITDPTKYTWVKIKGEQGTQGIPGINGVDGKTSYLHIKYSNDGGKTFASNAGETVGDYIGQCTDFNQNAPTMVGAYTWSKIKGEIGDTGTGIVKTVRYYKLQSSTLAKPSKPTKNQPDGWTDTEPSYVSGSTSTLYFVDCTIYSDQSFNFSEISISSSYEAAKDAWNKANNAQNTVDDLTIGGRNLILSSGDLTEWNKENGITVIKDDDWFKITDTSHANSRRGIYIDVPIESNTTYTFSVYGKQGNTEANYGGGPTVSGTNASFGDSKPIQNGTKFILTKTSGPTDNIWRVYLNINVNTKDNYAYFKLPKLERGDKATDWTPAPEDLENLVTDINNDTKELLIKQNAEVIKTCESIIIEAVKSCTKSDDFDSFQSVVYAQLQLLSNQLELKFTQTTNELKNVNDDLQSKFNTITKYFVFDVNGMTIGKVDNPYKVVIDNDRYSMIVDGEEVMWISDGKVFTPEIEITRIFKLFDYTIEQDSHGNVNCGYIGGDS